MSESTAKRARRRLHPQASAPTVEPLLYDRDQLCSVLGVSRATIDRFQAQGKLPQPLKLGSQRRWKADTIRRWIELGMPDRATFERTSK